MAAGKKVKLRPWTKDDVKTLKTLAREGTKTTAIAQKLKRSVGATKQKSNEARSIARGAVERVGLQPTISATIISARRRSFALRARMCTISPR